MYMLPRLSPLRSSPSAARMARALLRAVPVILHPSAAATVVSSRSSSRLVFDASSSLPKSSLFGRSLRAALCGGEGEEARAPRSSCSGRPWAVQKRNYRKVRRRAGKSKQTEKELELSVSICIEDDLPDDPEILVIHIFL